MGNWRYDQDAHLRDGITCKWCGQDICYHCPECGNEVGEHKETCKSDPETKIPPRTCGKLREEDEERLGALSYVTPDPITQAIQLLTQLLEVNTEIRDILRANRDGTRR